MFFPVRAYSVESQQDRRLGLHFGVGGKQKAGLRVSGGQCDSNGRAIPAEDQTGRATPHQDRCYALPVGDIVSKPIKS